MSYTQYWTQTDIMDYMGCNDQMNDIDPMLDISEPNKEFEEVNCSFGSACNRRECRDCWEAGQCDE